MGIEEQSLIPGIPDDIALDCLARVPQRFHSGLRPVCRRWRDLITTPFFRRRRHMIGAAEDLVFMVQALSPREPDGAVDTTADGSDESREAKGQRKRPPVYSLSLYNATLDTWHRAAVGTAAAPLIPMFAQCATVGDKLVLVGGWDPATLDPIPGVLVINPATGSWRDGTPMAAARSFFACAAAGGRIYVAGGHDGQKNALRSAEVYDVEADEWAALPPMAEERDECQGVVDGKGKFWAVSGYGTESQGRFDGSAEVYDPARGEWRKEDGLMGEGAPSASAFAAAGEGVWCVECGGGRREVREYEGSGWRAVAPAPEGMKSSPRAAAAVGGAGERVFVVGTDGEGGNGAWMLDVGSRRWRRVDTPPGFSGFVYSAAALRL